MPDGVTCRLEDTNASTGTLDTLVKSLEAKKSISTIDKSSYDWDKFKDAAGINEEVENAKKDGYECSVRFTVATSINRNSSTAWTTASSRRKGTRESWSGFVRKRKGGRIVIDVFVGCARAVMESSVLSVVALAGTLPSAF